MTTHLVKLAVGIDSFDHLQALQDQRRAGYRAEGQERLFATTRNTPRRGDSVLDGGSLYWVIKGVIRARQLITRLESGSGPEGQPRCLIHLDPVLVRTNPFPMRAFQGWRYLEPEKAPADLLSGGSSDGAADTGIDPSMPPEMIAELREMGVL